MKNKFKLTLIALGLLSFNQSYAAMQDWPVYDASVSAKIEALTSAILRNDGTLAQANAKMQTDLTNNATNTLSTNMTNLSVMQDQRKAIQNSVPTLDKCIAVTKSMSMGLMAKQQNTISKALETISNKTKHTKGSGNIYSIVQSSGKLKTCTPDEVNSKINGCSLKEDMLYSGADIDINVIRKNLLTGTKSIESEEQKRIVDQFVRNYLYASAPNKISNRDFANSVLYQAKYKEWYARVSPLEAGLNWEIQRNIGINIEGSPTLKSFWANPQNTDKYKQLNGGANPPAKPSFAETIQFMVLQDAFAADDASMSETKMSEIEVLREISRKLSLNNYLQHENMQLGIINKNIMISNTLGTLAPLDTNAINQLAPAGK